MTTQLFEIYGMQSNIQKPNHSDFHNLLQEVSDEVIFNTSKCIQQLNGFSKIF